jgi:hypothetical protein
MLSDADNPVVSMLPSPIPRPSTPTPLAFELYPGTPTTESYLALPILPKLLRALAFTSVTGRNISAILKEDICPTW